ncbi:MAG: ADP-ribosylglycohydrolase family protein [Fibrobacterota bacterium]|nr:ADP-ribosylglycohydrolase family protein [Fibrobacterota bacterium]QQS07563.1 MAG: ADP-ribosylglycohydrolase family protein [Fibrobacterota bacterium]
MNEQTWNRIQGGIYGMLVGDALGVPYEFQESAEIPDLDLIEFHPPADFRRSHEGVPPGTWSDDGAQALCLLASLLECGKLDQADYAQRLVDWYNQGYMAIDQKVFDVGVTTASSIRCLMNGISPENSGATGDYDNGNGSLMRVLPLALWHRGSDEDLVESAHRQSHITHAHMRSKVCCALYCLWARNILREDSEPWANALENLRRIYVGNPQATYELEWSVRPEQFEEGSGSGYVVDSLRTAFVIQKSPSFEAIVKAAVKIGNDTDTTACIAGGIAGLRFGMRSIPTRWIEDLRGKEIVEDLLGRLRKVLEKTNGPSYRIDTPGSQAFSASVQSLAGALLAKYGLRQVGPVQDHGSDPKGAGRLYLAFYEAPGYFLKIRTTDGAVEVLTGASSAPLDWSDLDAGEKRAWFWPSDSESETGVVKISSQDLLELRDNLSDGHVGWV